MHARTKGFSVIELLVVIGVLGILLSIVVIAISPKQQFAEANNTKRRSDINALLNAVNQYAAANKGALPSAITQTATTIGSGAGQINLCADLVPNYIADMPLDPKAGTETPANSVCTDSGAAYNTGYTIAKNATSNRVTVSAPAAEEGQTISVTR